MQSDDYLRSIAVEKERRTQQRLAELKARAARERGESPPEEDGGASVREPRRPTPGASPASVALEMTPA